MGFQAETRAKTFSIEFVSRCLAVAPPSGPDVPLIYHLDGRKYFTDRQRAEMGYSGNPDPVRGRRDPAAPLGE